MIKFFICMEQISHSENDQNNPKTRQIKIKNGKQVEFLSKLSHRTSTL